MVLERRERAKKAIVTEMDFGMKLSTIDQLAVEKVISKAKLRHTGSNKNKFRLTTRMTINCNKVEPYMVNIKELEGNSFRSIKKRLIMTGLRGKLKTLASVGKWEGPMVELLDGEKPVELLDGEKPVELLDEEKPVKLLDEEKPVKLLDGEKPVEPLEGKKPVVKFKNKNDIDISMTAFAFNVSMDDFYVITSISRKIVEEGLELAKIWTDYAVNDVLSEGLKNYKNETTVYP